MGLQLAVPKFEQTWLWCRHWLRLEKPESDSLGGWDCLGNWKQINICFSLRYALVCISEHLKFEKIPRRWAVSSPLPAPSPQNAAAVLRCNDYAVLHVHPSNIFHPLLLRFHLQLWFLLTLLRQPSKRETLHRCWFNIGPASQTRAKSRSLDIFYHASVEVW